jgi:AcrR family transcriptional regulator
MPRKRSELAREDKIEEILAAARDQLVGGYAQLSVKGIARDLGVGQAAVYWYFPSKDHLFVGAIESLFMQAWSRKPKTAALTKQVQWFAEELAGLYPYISALRSRAADSDVAGAFLTNVETQLRSILQGTLADQTATASAPDTAEVLLALLEGLAARDVTARRRQRLVAFALEALAPPRQGR